jgi:hypothetical protein
MLCSALVGVKVDKRGKERVRLILDGPSYAWYMQSVAKAVDNSGKDRDIEYIHDMNIKKAKKDNYVVFVTCNGEIKSTVTSGEPHNYIDIIYCCSRCGSRFFHGLPSGNQQIETIIDDHVRRM